MSRKKWITTIALTLSFVFIFGLPGQGFVAYADDSLAGEGEFVDAIEQDDTTENTEQAPEEPAPEPEPPSTEPTPAQKAAAESQQKITNYESQIANISSELESLKGENKKILASISNVKGEKEKKLAMVGQIDQQISLTDGEIGLTEERIQLLELNIAEKETNIALKQAEYEENNEIFLQRMRAMYMYDNSSKLGLILGSDSFSDFLTTTDMLTIVADHDQALMNGLAEEKAALEAEREGLEADKEAVEADKKEAEELRQNLATQRGVAAAAVQDVSALEQQYQADYEANKKKSEAMQAEINNIYKQIELSKNPYVGGQMQWPVPGFYQISSHFGWRFGRTDYHTGMDITGGGVHGSPVIAANAGTVRHVNWSHSPGRGYGMYVIIDHGGSMSTLYAHLSNISVTVGQEVAQGATIGNVGNTGWSTGPHLHFEVRNGTTPQNPLPYVQG